MEMPMISRIYHKNTLYITQARKWLVLHTRKILEMCIAKTSFEFCNFENVHCQK